MDPLALARLEHVLYQGLNSKFDGSPEKLPAAGFLNLKISGSKTLGDQLRILSQLLMLMT
jgi:hypothetical protein